MHSYGSPRSVRCGRARSSPLVACRVSLATFFRGRAGDSSHGDLLSGGPYISAHQTAGRKRSGRLVEIVRRDRWPDGGRHRALVFGRLYEFVCLQKFCPPPSRGRVVGSRSDPVSAHPHPRVQPLRPVHRVASSCPSRCVAYLSFRSVSFGGRQIPASGGNGYLGRWIQRSDAARALTATGRRRATNRRVGGDPVTSGRGGGCAGGGRREGMEFTSVRSHRTSYFFGICGSSGPAAASPSTRTHA